MSLKFLSVLFFIFVILILKPVYGEEIYRTNPLLSPESSVVEEGRQIIQRMIKNERGPYFRLRWFCADGTVHEPRPYACAERGGGKQYAEYSEDRARLAELGWHVGTIYAALDLNSPALTTGRRIRLRELPLEKYLVDIDEGWVLRRAKNYRGRVQAEDEETAGKQLLLGLLSDPAWINRNYLLLRELIRVVPHYGAGTDLTRSVRRISREIADLDPKFELLRIEIHTLPSKDTSAKIRTWLDQAGENRSPELDSKVNSLVTSLERLYGDAGRKSRLQALRDSMAGIENINEIKSLLSQVIPGQEPVVYIRQYSELLTTIRETVLTQIPASRRLLLLDSMADLEMELTIACNEYLQNPGLNRAELIDTAHSLVLAGYGIGLISAGEKNELVHRFEPLTGVETSDFSSYSELSKTLNLVSTWTIGSIRYNFAETLNRYTLLDSRISAYVDDTLRASTILQLAEIARRLNLDTQSLAGVRKTIKNVTAPSMLALNPGIATGQLRILSSHELEEKVDLNRNDIVVLPQTVSELSPVSGVMTLGEGNMLSHIQLLARNFGIPNISISQQDLEKLQSLSGQQVILLAGTDGSVLLDKYDDQDQRYSFLFQQQTPMDDVRLEVPQPDLSLKKLIPISELRKELSGVVVGPKAANLGELNRLFPGRVAPALAIPFGVFLDNVNRYEASSWNRLRSVYESYRRGELNDQQLSNELDDIRSAVAKVSLAPSLKNELQSMMTELFGQPDSYGLFLRSDTNVEDLPGFTGAGLSKTVANVVSQENQFAVIPEIWASVLAPRAIAWRSNLLKEPERIYPSVLLMKSVPSEKSGVLVTTDLYTRKTGLTVSTAWGVGGAVEGEITETLVLLENNSEILIMEAKTPYQRGLSDSGGFLWSQANDGSVLTANEKLQLRDLAAEVAERYQPVLDADGNALPWDIEFGFVNGELTLFQIRPLVERGQSRADRIIRTMNPVVVTLPETIDLTGLPVSTVM